ncbi:MAG: 16S rRNA (cytidine(1402)-2'-O)-methyltransferase [Alphaproteobacteria bacterium]|nr:16S rRNA (cytidine(1402)-2'-O)-methyltransferase [Alphaproteobacteria bacterium]
MGTGLRRPAGSRNGTGAQATDAGAASKPRSAGEPPAPGLHIVGTPIGNLGDITLRALTVLRGVDLIACEDTRVFAKLAAAHGIAAPTIAYADATRARTEPRVLAALAEGKRVALVSDAGMPLVSDPGYPLVRAAIERGHPVSVAPGPSAPLAALALSGLPSERFLFAGFLPTKSGERRRAIGELAAIPATLLFFEAPHRLPESLADLTDLLGPRPAAVARELTKLFEEVRRAPLDALARHYAEHPDIRGEIVVVVAPPGDSQPADAAEIDRALGEAMHSASLRDAAAEVAARFGRPRREVYARALELKRSQE